MTMKVNGCSLSVSGYVTFMFEMLLGVINENKTTTTIKPGQIVDFIFKTHSDQNDVFSISM